MSRKTRLLLGTLIGLVMVLGLMPGMGLTAYAYDGNPYTSLVNTTTPVTFNRKSWYIIADDSTAVDKGTVTLLAADTSFGTSQFHDSSNAYSVSTVKSKLDALTAEGGAFASVKDAIADTDLSDVGVTGAKLYLLSTSEVGSCPNVYFTDSYLYGGWWLRSGGYMNDYAYFVTGDNGDCNGGGDVSKSFGVRPALKLNLESVIFESESKIFSLPGKVTGVTLNPSAAQTIDVNGKVTFTATVAPENATDKTVKWSVDGSAVRLYSDEACKTEVGTDATETLTVYAKGVSAGEATVTVTSNEDVEATATCNVTVNVATHAVAAKVVPEGAGTVALGAAEVAEGATAGIEATPAEGYEFERWTVDGAGASIDDAASRRATLTMGTADATVTANFKKKSAPTPTPAPTVAKAAKPKTVAYVTKGKVAVSWKAAKGAKTYQLQWRKAGAKKWTTASVKDRKKTVAGLKKGVAYEFRVRGVNGKVSGKWSKASPCWLKGAAKVKAVAGSAKGTVKVSWKADKAATGGFKVFVYAKKGGKLVTTKKAKSGATSATVKGLKSGKKYYVRVRPYRTKSGATYPGAVSGWRSAKAK